MECCPPGSSIHGILQARVLEWVAMPSSRGSSWPRDWTRVSHPAGRFFTICTTRKAQIWKVLVTKYMELKCIFIKNLNHWVRGTVRCPAHAGSAGPVATPAPLHLWPWRQTGRSCVQAQRSEQWARTMLCGWTLSKQAQNKQTKTTKAKNLSLIFNYFSKKWFLFYIKVIH